jgi:hypothetical protein
VESPSLRPLAAGMLAQSYAIARARAIAETGLADEGFPAACPFSLGDILSRSFLPQPWRAVPIECSLTLLKMPDTRRFGAGQSTRPKRWREWHPKRYGRSPPRRLLFWTISITRLSEFLYWQF